MFALAANYCSTVTASYASSYQWNLNGTPIPGATNSTYTVPAAGSANAGNYSVTVTNGVGSVTSSIAIVAVGSSITANPASVSLHPTQTALFSVSGQGLGPLSYQWYQIPSGGTTGVALSGATSSDYVTPPVDISYDGAQYYATVTDACGPLTSAEASLTVTAGNVPPTITTEPVGETVGVGGTTSFTVVASGTPALSYQWYRIPAGQKSGSAIAGATSATYTVPASATATHQRSGLLLRHRYQQLRPRCLATRSTRRWQWDSASDHWATCDSICRCRFTRHLSSHCCVLSALDLSVVRSRAGQFHLRCDTRGNRLHIYVGFSLDHGQRFRFLCGREQRRYFVRYQQLRGTICWPA